MFIPNASVADVKKSLKDFPNQLNEIRDGKTCLMNACEDGRLEVVQFLLSLGADMEIGASNEVFLLSKVF